MSWRRCSVLSPFLPPSPPGQTRTSGRNVWAKQGKGMGGGTHFESTYRYVMGVISKRRILLLRRLPSRYTQRERIFSTRCLRRHRTKFFLFAADNNVLGVLMCGCSLSRSCARYGALGTFARLAGWLAGGACLSTHERAR
ncbi:hypothetical protein IQ07DRAFT_60490 [Pyrenochaeta sp. DS3sAY3a]|nr:hypothetical protein IQ07DRAFT_60490 [Pyrenochaeta sp. DS3sAY3a]